MPALSPRTSTAAHLGPYTRECRVRFDENALIFAALRERPAGVMLDVGARWGEAFRPFAEQGWQVHAFEPAIENLERFRAKWAAQDVHIHHEALSDQPAEDVPFYTSPESEGIGSLAAFRDTHAEAFRCRVSTLREVAERERLERIDYLKIDAEGHDLMVLRGLPWERLQPEVILCEFEDSKTRPLGYELGDMLALLADQAYHVLVSEWHPILSYGHAHDWRALCPAETCRPHPEGWGNLIATRNPAQRDALLAHAPDFLSYG